MADGSQVRTDCAGTWETRRMGIHTKKPRNSEFLRWVLTFLSAHQRAELVTQCSESLDVRDVSSTRYQARRRRPDVLIHLYALQSPEVPKFLIKSENRFGDEQMALGIRRCE